MLKPDYLYHGSQYRFHTLIPQKATGINEKESLCAIYAAETFDEVIPFALPFRWYPDDPHGVPYIRTCDNGRSILEYGSINPNGVGYVYKVKSDTFEKIDDWQWVSYTSVFPLEVVEIKVCDYWNTITFSEKSKEIIQELYGVSIDQLNKFKKS